LYNLTKMSEGVFEMWETMPMGYFQDLVLQIDISHRFSNINYLSAFCQMYYSNYSGTVLTDFSAVMLPPNYVYIKEISPVPTTLPTDIYPWCQSSSYYINNVNSDPQNNGTYVMYYVSYVKNGVPVTCTPIECWTYPQYAWFWPNPSDDLVASVLQNPSAKALVKSISQRAGPKYLGLNPNSNANIPRPKNSSMRTATSVSQLKQVTEAQLLAECKRLQHGRGRLVTKDEIRGCIIHEIQPTPPPAKTAVKTSSSKATVESEDEGTALHALHSKL